MLDLARLAGKSFLVLGRAGIDLSPDPPGTAIVAAARFSACLGGSSGNIAAALTRQGCGAELVSCLSDDAVGRFCLAELDRYGIGRAHVRLVGGEARTSLALSESRLEDHQTVIYRNGAADFELTVADVEAVDYARHSALIVTGTALAAEPSRGAVFRAFDLAREAGLPLILDVDYRPYSWTSAAEAAAVYSRAAALSGVIVGNDVEFGFMAGGLAGGLARARELVRDGAGIVVYKRGAAGAVTITPELEFRTGIYRTDALKPTGAGDAFLGGMVAALASGQGLEAAVLRGSAAAAIVVSRVGCAPAMPTATELDDFLAGHSGPTPA